MAESDFLFEEGSTVDVGQHGEHDFVFAGGTEVTDTGISSLVYEEGTGIGGGGALVIRYGEDTNNFGGTGKIDQALDEVLGTDSNQVFDQDAPLDEALAENIYGLLVVTCESDADSLDQAEQDALSDWWANEAEQGILILGEHGTSRAGLMNDFIENTTGGRPYDDTGNKYDRQADYGSGGTGGACLDPAVPTGLNPPLENISAVTAFDSEGSTFSPNGDEGTFYSVDPSEGPRLYADGTYTRFGDAWDCADNQQYVTQSIEWLNRNR